jgi:peptidyl-prolyl cis-trans isomerase A (cyclophilin A)
MNTHACRLLRTMLAGLMLTGSVRAQLFADFQTTKGTFTVELFHQDVPRTVANFVSLAEGTRTWTDARTNKVRVGVPLYDGTIFHRVAAIPTLIIQGGSPKRDGSDGPGYKFPDEFTRDAATTLLHKHVTGALSMANSGVHTNGSQFFLIATGAPLTGLDDKHTVFAKIAAGPAGTAAQGQAVVDAISTVPLMNERPVTDVVIDHVAIRRVGASAMAFDPLAWKLPTVGHEIEPTNATVTLADPGTVANLVVTYPALIHTANLFEESADLITWTRVPIGGGAPTSVIRLLSEPRPFTYSGLNGVKQKFLRVRAIDYSALIAQTFQPLSASASLRLRFTDPAIQVTLTRVGAGGTWVLAAPAASGQLASTNYPLPNGDAGLFSPVLGMTMANPMPWRTGVALKELYVLLTFDAGSTTKGSFVVDGYTSATPSVRVSGKGVFSVLVP